jgi:hypothetical protein
MAHRGSVLNPVGIPASPQVQNLRLKSGEKPVNGLISASDTGKPTIHIVSLSRRIALRAKIKSSLD